MFFEFVVGSGTSSIGFAVTFCVFCTIKCLRSSILVFLCFFTILAVRFVIFYHFGRPGHFRGCVFPWNWSKSRALSTNDGTWEFCVGCQRKPRVATGASGNVVWTAARHPPFHTHRRPRWREFKMNFLKKSTYICIYIYICMCIQVHIYIYIYISNTHQYVYIYIYKKKYIYIYI